MEDGIVEAGPFFLLFKNVQWFSADGFIPGIAKTA